MSKNFIEEHLSRVVNEYGLEDFDELGRSERRKEIVACLHKLMGAPANEPRGEYRAVIDFSDVNGFQSDYIILYEETLELEEKANLHFDESRHFFIDNVEGYDASADDILEAIKETVEDDWLTVSTSETAYAARKL